MLPPPVRRRFVVTTRLLFVLVMLILPLQATWSVAAAYCTHDADAPSAHVGHHAHEHGMADPGADTSAERFAKSKGKAPTGADFDCALCHLATAGLLTAPRALDLVAAAPRRAIVPQIARSFAQAPPDRPDRMRAA